MKKNGRKGRKLQAEKLERKKNQQNVPFSKERKVVHTCKHFGVCSGSYFNIGISYSDIIVPGLPGGSIKTINKIALQSPKRVCMKCGKSVHERGYHYVSKLVLTGENECKCNECGAVYPVEIYNRMEQLVDVLSNEVIEDGSARLKKLTERLEATYYRRVSEQEKEICGMVGLAKVMKGSGNEDQNKIWD